MADTLTQAKRSQLMSRIRSKNTTAELVVRKLVYRMGIRYRLHRKDLPGTPDLVFRRMRKVIFVHGCFWHQHSSPECRIVRVPKSHVDFWLPKFEKNHKRDICNEKKLTAAGWRVLVVWECQLRNEVQLEHALKCFLAENP